MKVIKFSIHPAADGEVVNAAVSIQRKRGDAWLIDEVISIVSNQAGAERTLVLDDTQRIVIEGTSNTEVVYDREQNAAVTRPVERPPVKATPPSTDGDEDTGPSLIDKAMGGSEFNALKEQERRDQAIQAAKEKLAQQQKEDRAKQEAAEQTQPSGSNEPPIGSDEPPRPTPPAQPGFPPPKPKVQF
jgi:hypothetical protein